MSLKDCKTDLPCNIGYSCGTTFHHWEECKEVPTSNCLVGCQAPPKQYRSQIKSYISDAKAQKLLNAFSTAEQAQYSIGYTTDFLSPYIDLNCQIQLTITTQSGILLNTIAAQGQAKVVNTFVNFVNDIHIQNPGSILVVQRFLTSNSDWFITFNEVYSFYSSTGLLLETVTSIVKARIDNCAQIVITSLSGITVIESLP